MILGNVSQEAIDCDFSPQYWQSATPEETYTCRMRIGMIPGRRAAGLSSPLDILVAHEILAQSWTWVPRSIRRATTRRSCTLDLGDSSGC